MPKQLINLIGVLVSVAILALGILLVAVPLIGQALGTYANADQVDQTNKLYQAQVDALTKAKQTKDQTDASVAALREQIAASPELDQVFDLVAKSAQSSGVTVDSVTAGKPSTFVARAGATTLRDQEAAGVPSPEPSASAGDVVGDAQQTAGEASSSNSASGTTPAGGSTASSSTRTQIDFAIKVGATSIDQVNAFLDALRAGPRLLANITSTVATSGSGIQVSITALTFVDGAPIATGATK